MCGIALVADITGGRTVGELEQVARAMCDSVAHRGPDDQGTFVDERWRIALGHRRLSIVDLSPAGHQPMVSADERWALTFNGEIYNHRELRARLRAEGSSFRGRSDTEVLLEALQRWGVGRAVERLDGMFAFALLDRREGIVHLARDRFGEKPLYWGVVGGTLVVASEAQSLRVVPGVDLRLDHDALAGYLRLGYVPEPSSIYDGFSKLRPGSRATIDLADGTVDIHEWFDARAAVVAAIEEPWPDDPAVVLDEVGDAIRRSVRSRYMADVPVGAFLSGGLDSTLVVALLVSELGMPVSTFTIGSEDRGYDESEAAAEVARHLGTEHHQVIVSSGACLSALTRLPDTQGEPFADSSIIPTTLVSELARQHVTVAITGDGGDELFGGYERYRRTLARWQRLDALPLGVRRTVAPLVGAVPGPAIEALGSLSGRSSWTPARVERSAAAMCCRTVDDLYRLGRSAVLDPSTILRRGSAPSTALDEAVSWADRMPALDRMMLADTLDYLPGDILAKVDRAAMSVSLETRVPLLAPEVASAAWRIPSSWRSTPQEGKLVVRALLRRLEVVPTSVLDRPKRGFAIPVQQWLRGPLRSWADDLLDPVELADQGIFHVDAVRRLWDDHQTRSDDGLYHLWSVLMFQAWLRSHPTRA